MTAHAFGTGVVPMNARVAGFAGDLGVRAFFVLSGFLITTLLLRELERTKGISLLGFYVRRAFRIFPAFYTYLFVIGAFSLIGTVELLENDFLAAATYTTNFHSERSWWTGHLWSLAVEEQFYVIWPLALVALGLLRAWWFAAIAVLAAPLLRVAVWFGMPGHRDLADQAFPCVFDALAVGCLLAYAAPQIARSPRVARFFDGRWFWLLPLLCVATLFVRNPLLRYGAAMSIANVAIAVMIIRCVARPKSRVTRVLELRPFVWVGGLSYSLYLWQQLFLNRHADAWMHQFPINIGLAFCAAIACHYLIERPALRFADRWRTVEPPATVLGEPLKVLDVSLARARRSQTLPTVGTVEPLHDLRTAERSGSRK
jgi:peptidoglycan/LPS O-acetylase OafA/YrhL